MNGKQKFVIWAATFLVAAMGLYPPWVHVHRWSQERRYAYGWIFGSISESMGRIGGSSGNSWLNRWE
jgi:hypothetical protein